MGASPIITIIIYLAFLIIPLFFIIKGIIKAHKRKIQYYEDIHKLANRDK